MTDDVVTCGGLSGGDRVVDLRCPDCGPQAMDVVSMDRREGVLQVRCPRCGSDLFTNGTVPLSRTRPKETAEEFGPLPALPGNTLGEDDGE